MAVRAMTGPATPARVLAVAAKAEHRFSKTMCGAIDLIAGLGVRGDAHSGAAVRHRGRVAVTGLRNPCAQLDAYQDGLLAAVLDRDADGGLIRKAGVIAVVLRGGTVRPSDPITATLPPEPYRRLERV